MRSPLTFLLLVVAGAVFLLDLYKQILQEVVTNWHLPLLVAAIAIVAALLDAARQCRAASLIGWVHTLTAADSRVRRDGGERVCSSHALVPGDIVLLQSGDIVPADCRLIEASGLRCDENTLTGATMPTEKYADAIFDDITPLAQRTNMLYAGTTITAGHAVAVVVATGMRSEMGHESRNKPRTQTNLPMQKKAGRLSLWWSVTATMLGVVALIWGFARVEDRSTVLLTAVAITTAAVPTGIAALYTRLTSGSISRLLRRHHVRTLRPEAADVLGKVTVLGVQQDMLHSNDDFSLCRACVGHHDIDLTANVPNVPGLGLLLRMAALNTAENDPADTAILARLNKLGIDKNELLMDMPRIGELTPSNGRKTAVHLAEDQTLILVSDGWRTLLPLCTKGNTEAITNAAVQMEKDGLQVVAVAYRLTDTAPAVYTAEELEHDLICAGLLGLYVPLRSAVAADARVRNILFSDDSVASAVATAAGAGFGDDIRAITGEEMQQFDDYDLIDAVEHCDVYCGLDTTQKQRVITALQQQGEVVAFTSRRIDEAELLTIADVGIARGTAATDVVKTAADMILLEDDFATVSAAMSEGRRLRREKMGMFIYLSLCSIAVVFVGCGSFYGLFPLAYAALLMMGLHLLLMALPTPLFFIFGISNTMEKLRKKS